MTQPPAINVIHLMPALDELLLELLKGLSDQDWQRPTIAPKWRVIDVAAHLLDGNLRALSMLRDGYYGVQPGPIHAYGDLVDYLNGLNADWIRATSRLSSKVLIDMLAVSGKWYCDFLATLHPDEKATFSVAWAGENESKNWFHIAREYTEKWHHQQQIRRAVGDDGTLLQEQWFLPYLDTSVRALPYHYRNVVGRDKEVIQFSFIGETVKNWYLQYDNGWELYTAIEPAPIAEVKIPDDCAWRIFTKGMTKKEAMLQSEIIGDQNLGEKVFDMLAVMG